MINERDEMLEELDITERKMRDYPALYREYLYFEDAVCSPYSQTWIPKADWNRYYDRLDFLYAFFCFDYTRSKYNSDFWSKGNRNRQDARKSSR